jgi:hypothetical protein
MKGIFMLNDEKVSTSLPRVFTPEIAIVNQVITAHQCSKRIGRRIDDDSIIPPLA